MRKLKLPRCIQWIALTAVIFLLLMSLLRVALFLSFVKPQLPASTIVNAFLLGFRYDARMVCSVSLLFFIISFIPGLCPLGKKWGRRISFLIWGILIVFFSLMYIIDFGHYAYLSQRLNAIAINYLYDAKISGKMIWQTYHVFWISGGLIIVSVLLLSLIRVTYNIVLSTPKTATKFSRVIWSVVFFLLLALGIFGRVGQYPLRWSDSSALGNDYAVNLALNPFQSFFSTLRFRRSGFDLNKTKKAYPIIARYFDITKRDSLNYTRYEEADSTQTNHPNVVLVICESFSAYKSSMYGNPLNTTPFFNKLCNEGIFFERCFTPSYGTARGVWATVTGIPDVQILNTSSRNPACVNQHTIINDFKGYEKYYFIGGSTSWANIRGLLTNNIDSLHLFEQDNYHAKKIDVWGVSDKNVLLEANKTLAKQQKPFFAVIQTADNHRPYTIPKEDRSEFVINKVPTDTLKKYGFSTLEEYNAFRYTDFCFKKFIEAAQKEPYFKNTIFVFVGDHGISGNAGNMFPKAWTEQTLTSEHVPLLFYAPAILQPKRYSLIASQVDILPTIAGLCNVSYYNTTLGKDLLKRHLSIDAEKHNAAFIFNPDFKRIGIVYDNIYYTFGLDKGAQEHFSSVINNKEIKPTDSMKTYYHSLTDAFYQTARYMLFNNKKDKLCKTK